MQIMPGTRKQDNRKPVPFCFATRRQLCGLAKAEFSGGINLRIGVHGNEERGGNDRGLALQVANVFRADRWTNKCAL
jgi:hypothetical protein